jgi:hypothetical protein
MLNGKSAPIALREQISGSEPLNSADFRAAARELLKALDYARAGQRDIWDFAVEISTLRETGLSDADFRWLVCLGHVEHACEVTTPRDLRRQFQSTGKLSFKNGTCFVLTESGAEFARTNLNGRSTFVTESSVARRSVDGSQNAITPQWDANIRELRLGGALVKQFRWPAVNQEMILAVFQEVGWKPHIEDPLPPKAEQDSKRRLHDTIKCLNRNQYCKLMRFYGDGTGEGVLWRLNKPYEPTPRTMERDLA